MPLNYHLELQLITLKRLKQEEEDTTHPIRIRKRRDIFEILVKQL